MREKDIVDLLVVGGGINGTGIARDAAGRGLKVVLCEQEDLGQQVSSASSRLIHDRFLYVKGFQFGRLREALVERDILRATAPHATQPLRVVLPYDIEKHPDWRVRLGLQLYGYLGAGRTSGLGDHQPGGSDCPLDPVIHQTQRYDDCWFDDSRLTVLNAMDAAAKGAEILTRTRCIGANRIDGLWQVDLASNRGAPMREIKARVLVNAAGPWAREFLEKRAEVSSTSTTHLTKSSHIVVKKLYDHDRAYALQLPDVPLVFVIPFEQEYTLIAMSEQPYEGDAGQVDIDDEDIACLLTSVNHFFFRQTKREDVVWCYATTRTHYDGPLGQSQDYVLDVATASGAAPLLSVFGGRTVTHRKLAEQVLERLKPMLGLKRGPWTADSPLPGGDLPDKDLKIYLKSVERAKPWLPTSLARRYVGTYGTMTDRLLKDANQLGDLGRHLGDGLYEVEIRYLMRHEWAVTEDDILWRRSMLGLHITKKTADELRTYLAGNGLSLSS